MEIRLDVEAARARMQQYYEADSISLWEELIADEDNLLVFLALVAEAARYDLFHDDEAEALAHFVLESCEAVVKELGLGRPEPEEPEETEIDVDDTPAIRAYDNLGTFERWTVVFDLDALPAQEKGCRIALFMSDHPEDHDGVSEWGEVVIGHHLGQEIAFDELPEEVSEHVMARIRELSA